MSAKSKKTDVSVVTINYKEAKVTTNCINKLLKQKKVKVEIIVIDNSCDRKQVEKLKSVNSERIILYVSQENLGCAKGYNLGIKKAQGKYVFIVNNDTELRDQHALFKLKKYLDKNKQVGVLQPKIKALNKPDYFEYSGAAGGFLDDLGYPFCRGRIFQTVEKDKGQYDDIIDISWASTCAFFARKDVIIEAGLFDSIYFAYAEEVDMSLKIWNLGYRVVFFPKTEIFHRGETSWKKRRGIKTFYIHRNHLILYFKCFPIKTMLINLPQRIILEFLSIIFYIFNNSFLHTIPVFMSYFSFIGFIPRIIKSRKIFFRNYKRNENPIYRKSIVVEYFIHKKKYYRDLNIKKNMDYGL